MTERIFVSYSHHDAPLVSPVVRLLRSTNDFVFQDSDSIKPGQKWREALGQAIEQANLVVVFWCLHSNESLEVEREYRSAIEARKDVLPVLLDSTPVPPALGEYQWIDFRELGRGRHPAPGTSQPPPAPVAAAPRPRWLAAIATSAAALVLIVGASLWMLLSRGAEDPPGTTPSVTLPPETASSPLSVWVIGMLVVLGLIALIALKRFRPAARKKGAPNRQDQVMAQALEGELRRRLRSQR